MHIGPTCLPRPNPPLTPPADQAIYGFRGAKSSMLQEQFNRVYAGSAATFYLSDNYRSRPPIVMLGDSIRKHL